MSPLPRELWFFIPLAAIVIAIAILWPSPTGYAGIVLFVVFAGLFHVGRTRPDRGFLLTCSSVPLVVTCALQNIWAGAGAACLLAGIVSSAMGLLESPDDNRSFGLFCGSVVVIALLIMFSNHVTAPLLIIAGITCLVLFIQSVRNYQFRKEYSGAG